MYFFLTSLLYSKFDTYRITLKRSCALNRRCNLQRLLKILYYQVNRSLNIFINIIKIIMFMVLFNNIPIIKIFDKTEYTEENDDEMG
jgi:hypothetical protein